ncbi:aldo/keto reductase [Croceicoccus estronivorus]|uniref:aldo/keto reductase n=1 Tax=Croceicoccus estronivorus TaxID=1172626 RepID=UPI000AFC4453
MKRKLAGKDVHPIGLGCMNLCWAYGEPPSREDAVSLLRQALDLGYDHFDTANIYGLGKSEELIAEALKGRRQEFFLASKTGIVTDGGVRGVDCKPESISASIDASLGRLETDHIDLLYLHRFDPKVPVADSVGALVRAMEAGKIGAYGVSEWSAAHIREAHAVHPMAAVQTEYSLWTRNVELGVLETTHELGIAFVAFSPVGRGALCGELVDPARLPEHDFRRTMPRFMNGHWAKNHQLIEQLVGLAGDSGMTAAQLALAWVLSRGDHIHVIPGTANLQHLDDNFHATTKPVGQDVLDRADRLINQQTVSGHRYPDAMRLLADTEEYA